MANTYTLISSVTVGSGGASSIDFTSIPATYTDLLLKVSTRSDRNTGGWTNMFIRFNNDSSAIYSDRYVYGTGATVYSGSDASATWSQIGESNQTNTATNVFSSTDIYISNYAGSNYKSVSIDSTTEQNATDVRQYLTAALWSSTSAINRVTVLPAATFNWVQYTTAYLYGIKNS